MGNFPLAKANGEMGKEMEFSEMVVLLFTLAIIGLIRFFVVGSIVERPITPNYIKLFNMSAFDEAKMKDGQIWRSGAFDEPLKGAGKYGIFYADEPAISWLKKHKIDYDTFYAPYLLGQK